MNFTTAELERRISNLLRVGVIEQADYAKALVRVQLGGLTSEWLPWVTRRAGGDIDWWAPEVGEQVMVLSPSGLQEDAFVLPALYSNSRPEPEQSPDLHTVRYANGDIVRHNRSTGAWFIQCAGEIIVQAGGNVTLIAAGPVLVQAPSVTLDTPETTCTGNLTVAKNLAIQGGSGGTSTRITGDIEMRGNLDVEGSLSVTGNINAGGSVIDAGGNTNHHSH